LHHQNFKGESIKAPAVKPFKALGKRVNTVSLKELQILASARLAGFGIGNNMLTWPWPETYLSGTLGTGHFAFPGTINDAFFRVFAENLIMEPTFHLVKAF
jgi:hypothetical protein